jgi:hypothetical protein
VDITEQGAAAQIDRLAKKYLDVDRYPYRGPAEVRVTDRIQPTHTTQMG